MSPEMSDAVGIGVATLGIAALFAMVELLVWPALKAWLERRVRR
jgi:hypothetical protein